MKIFVSALFFFAIAGVGFCEILTKCELVQELIEIFPRESLADWNCLAQNVDKLVGKRHKEKIYDHGLFQINKGPWCSHGKGKSLCLVQCSGKNK